MNSKILLAPLIITLLAAGAVYAVHTWNVDTAEPVVTQATQANNLNNTPEEIEDTSLTLQSTTTPNGTFIIDQSVPIEDRCTPVTLACLEVQPEWNPTVAVEGMRRVEAPVAYPVDDPELQTRDHINFVSETLRSTYTPEDCNGYEQLTKQEQLDTLQVCSAYDPEQYQHINIYERNTGAPIHALQLDSNFSLILSRENFTRGGRF
jgi:hypothetical protein